MAAASTFLALIFAIAAVTVAGLAYVVVRCAAGDKDTEPDWDV